MQYQIYIWKNIIIERFWKKICEYSYVWFFIFIFNKA